MPDHCTPSTNRAKGTQRTHTAQRPRERAATGTEAAIHAFQGADDGAYAADSFEAATYCMLATCDDTSVKYSHLAAFCTFAFDER